MYLRIFRYRILPELSERHATIQARSARLYEKYVTHKPIYLLGEADASLWIELHWYQDRDECARVAAAIGQDAALAALWSDFQDTLDPKFTPVLQEYEQYEVPTPIIASPFDAPAPRTAETTEDSQDGASQDGASQDGVSEDIVSEDIVAAEESAIPVEEDISEQESSESDFSSDAELAVDVVTSGDSDNAVEQERNEDVVTAKTQFEESAETNVLDEDIVDEDEGIVDEEDVADEEDDDELKVDWDSVANLEDETRSSNLQAKEDISDSVEPEIAEDDNESDEPIAEDPISMVDIAENAQPTSKRKSRGSILSLRSLRDQFFKPRKQLEEVEPTVGTPDDSEMIIDDDDIDEGDQVTADEDMDNERVVEDMVAEDETPAEETSLPESVSDATEPVQIISPEDLPAGVYMEPPAGFSIPQGTTPDIAGEPGSDDEEESQKQTGFEF